MIPDVRLSDTGRANGPLPVAATAAVAEPIELITLIDEEVEEAFLEIREAVSHDVVTVIELLSPTNKTSGARGRHSFLAKRHDILRSPAA